MVITKDRKREFARNQFDELIKMGFSRRIAGAIMSAARPRLAVKAAEWSILLWLEMEKLVEKEDAILAAIDEDQPTEYYDDFDGVVFNDFHDPANEGNVRSEIKHYLETLIIKIHGQQSNDAARSTMEKHWPGIAVTWPSSNPKELEQLALGVSEAIADRLPIQR